ncbi:Hypothetical predicted protein [Xyrichtys novacula]|uniref:Uncharacterized protein n=1 Tax=Xyrichtys novacula TaxID=13765 RepID=A0AAV1FDE6_XYRNO|nr:Hypothetical predicted protein [Xyrichtys novacula]
MEFHSSRKEPVPEPWNHRKTLEVGGMLKELQDSVLAVCPLARSEASLAVYVRENFHKRYEDMKAATGVYNATGTRLDTWVFTSYLTSPEYS